MKKNDTKLNLNAIQIEGVQRLENLHKIVGGIEQIGTGNCCTVCGLAGLDPRFSTGDASAV